MLLYTFHTVLPTSICGLAECKAFTTGGNVKWYSPSTPSANLAGASTCAGIYVKSNAGEHAGVGHLA